MCLSRAADLALGGFSGVRTDLPGVTARLRDAGKPVRAIPPWLAQFRRTTKAYFQYAPAFRRVNERAPSPTLGCILARESRPERSRVPAFLRPKGTPPS